MAKTVAGRRFLVKLTVENAVRVVARVHRISAVFLKGSVVSPGHIQVDLVKKGKNYGAWNVFSLKASERLCLNSIVMALEDRDFGEELFFGLNYRQLFRSFSSLVSPDEVRKWCEVYTCRLVMNLAKFNSEKFWEVWEQYERSAPEHGTEDRSRGPSLSQVKKLQDDCLKKDLRAGAIPFLLQICHNNYYVASMVLLEQCHVDLERLAKALLRECGGVRGFEVGRAIVTREGFVVEPD